MSPDIEKLSNTIANDSAKILNKQLNAEVLTVERVCKYFRAALLCTIEQYVATVMETEDWNNEMLIERVTEHCCIAVATYLNVVRMLNKDKFEIVE